MCATNSLQTQIADLDNNFGYSNRNQTFHCKSIIFILRIINNMNKQSIHVSHINFYLEILQDRSNNILTKIQKLFIYINFLIWLIVTEKIYLIKNILKIIKSFSLFYFYLKISGCNFAKRNAVQKCKSIFYRRQLSLFTIFPFSFKNNLFEIHRFINFLDSFLSHCWRNINSTRV